MKTRKCIVAALALLVGYSVPASGQPVNGDFEDELIGWVPELPDTPIGDVSAINVLGNGLAALQEGSPSPGTPTSASRSSISQVFNMPASAERLSFRYRLSVAPIIRDSPVPPDSLSVFLSAPGAPTPILPVFYVDSDGTMQFDPANTEVSQYEDPDGLRSVIFDVSAAGLALADTIGVTMEFGLAATGNAVTSFAVIDDVTLNCPTGFCCDPSSAYLEISDGDLCTKDICTATGEIWHLEICAIDCNIDSALDVCQLCQDGQIVIDFEQFPVGQILGSVDTNADGCPVTTFGQLPAAHVLANANTAVIFDSANPHAGDLDLGTPNRDFPPGGPPGPGVGDGGASGSEFQNNTALGNILVVMDHLTDGDSDGLVDVPDDTLLLTQLIFGFSNVGTVQLDSVTVIDVENTNSKIELFNAGGTLLETVSNLSCGNNGVRVIDMSLTQNGVDHMIIHLEGEGAVDNILATRDFCDDDANNDGILDDCQQPEIWFVESANVHGSVGILRLKIEPAPLKYVEPRLDGITQIIVTFDRPVDATTAQNPANISIVGVNNPSPAPTVTPTLDSTGQQLTIDLSPALPDGDCYTVDLSGITAMGFPINADHKSFIIMAVKGDVDRNGTTSTGDAAIIKPRFGADPADVGAEYDYNSDGVISTGDASGIKPLFGSTAPACP